MTIQGQPLEIQHSWYTTRSVFLQVFYCQHNKVPSICSLAKVEPGSKFCQTILCVLFFFSESSLLYFETGLFQMNREVKVGLDEASGTRVGDELNSSEREWNLRAEVVLFHSPLC